METLPKDTLMHIRPVWAEVDLDALAFTISSIRERAGKDRHVAAVVKANAYGHGAVEILSLIHI